MSIPFDVPRQFAAGLADGSLVRFGALLKDSGTGQVVAHLQETGVVPRLLSGVSRLPLAPTELLSGAVAIDNNLKLRQLTSLVQTLQSLQYATMGIALVGVGVSVAGFALMNRRLKGIEGEISNLKTLMEKQFRELHLRELRARFALASTCLERAENAHRFREPAPELRGAAERLAESSGFFKAEVKFALKEERVNMELVRSFTYAMLLCDTTRVECLVGANEMDAAMCIAECSGADWVGLFDEIDAVTLTRRVSAATGDGQHSYSELRELRLRLIEPFLQLMNEATEAGITRAALIQSLVDRGIEGSEYLQRVRKEEKEPILMLPALTHPAGR